MLHLSRRERIVMVDTLVDGAFAAQLRRVQECIKEMEGAGRAEDAEAVKFVKELAEQAVAERRQGPARELLTTGQAALALGISDQTVRNWVAAGRLAAVKRGVRTMIPRQAVIDEIERSRVRPETLPVLTPEQEAAAVAGRKEALAALPGELVTRLGALHDRLEDGYTLSEEEKAEMVRLEREITSVSARRLHDRIRRQRSSSA
jgi:excisionase family DNA binding protein